MEQALADLIDFYRPQNSQELFAVERIGLAQQAFRRAYQLEDEVFSKPIDEAGVKLLRVAMRYHAQADLLYRRAVEDFERLVAHRDRVPCEPFPEMEAETEADETVIPAGNRAALPIAFAMPLPADAAALPAAALQSP